MIGKPSLTVLLVASPETRLRRIAMRNADDYDLVDFEKHVYGYDKMKICIEKFGLPSIVVETDNLTIDETIALIIKEIDLRISDGHIVI